MVSVEVQMVRELHILNHLLLYQEWVHLTLAHGCSSGGGHLLLLLLCLLVLERGKHLRLCLRLGLLSRDGAVSFSILIFRLLLIDCFALVLKLLFILDLDLGLFLLWLFLLMLLLDFLLL